MPAQGDLQDWLRQLKERAEQQGGGESPTPKRSAPPPRTQAMPRPKSAPSTRSRQNMPIGSQAKPLGAGHVSATDAALARLREEEKREQEANRQEEEARNQEKRRRAAKRIKAEDDERKRLEEAEKQSRRKRKTQRQSLLTEKKSGKAVGKRVGSGPLYRNLRGNPAALKQAIIMAEVLGQPKTLRKSDRLV